VRSFLNFGPTQSRADRQLAGSYDLSSRCLRSIRGFHAQDLDASIGTSHDKTVVVNCNSFVRLATDPSTRTPQIGPTVRCRGAPGRIAHTDEVVNLAPMAGPNRCGHCRRCPCLHCLAVILGDALCLASLAGSTASSMALTSR